MWTFRLRFQKEMTVHQIDRSHEGMFHWDLRFIMNLTIGRWNSTILIELLYGLNSPNNSLDVWRWWDSGDGLCTVSSFYKRLLVR